MKKLCFRSLVIWPLFAVMVIVIAGTRCYSQGNNPVITAIPKPQQEHFGNTVSLSGDTVSLKQHVTPVNSTVNLNKPDLLNPMLQNRVVTANDSVYNNILPLKEYHLE